MPYVTEDNLTDVALERWKDIPDPRLRRIFPTTRGTVENPPLRLGVLPGLSRSIPSSAVAKRLE